MRFPVWSDLLDEQKDVLDHPLDKHLFVVGPPGSGKTTLAIQRAQQLANAELSTKIITYNRMLRRLINLATANKVSTATMQSLVARHFYHLTKTFTPTHEHDRYAYNWNAISEVLKDLDTPTHCCNHLVVDEAQDLCSEFFAHATLYLCKTITVFADDDQALTDFGSSLEEIRSAAGLSEPLLLKNNHRNTPQIAGLAEHFHTGRLPAARVRRQVQGDTPSLVSIGSLKEAASRIINWHSNRGGAIGVIVNLNQTGKQLIQEIASLKPELQLKMYTDEEKNEDSIDVTASGVTILNKASVKGQEFDSVFMLDLNHFLPCHSDSQKRAMYMMCCRARDFLFLLNGPTPLGPEAMACLPESDLLLR
jgi:DNA helicase IV